MQNNNLNVGKRLKISEAAKLLHVSIQTVRDWTEAGKLPAVLSDGGHRFYMEDEVHKLALAEQGVTTYWAAFGNVRMDQNSNFHLIDEESNIVREIRPIETGFDESWNDNDHFSSIPRSLVVDGKPVIMGASDFPAWKDYMGIEEDSKDANGESSSSGVMTHFRVMALTKEELPSLIKRVVKENMDYMKVNLKPVPTIVWKIAVDGELVAVD